ncbi:MAG: DUF3224 domain-containing protein [Ardenticatenaceae bacterium]|nr:DUF3224 domain-containing protein [Anaerolineales bacterium]MCB9006563.1 DUF3224 domain-containing protein [Ardenticatenaceae bacterium]
MKASGTFEVKIQPLDSYVSGSEGTSLGRMSIDKTFQGDLSGQSAGQMLTAMTAVEGSAGYVAIEQVEGTLGGKKGTFVLQHFGTIDEGGQRLILEVVPDSGTGKLAGLSGSMTIHQEDGQHFYEFEYTLA